MPDFQWPTSSLSVKTTDVEFHYFEFGRKDGIPIIFLHGFPDAPGGWRQVLRGLDHARFRIVVPYLRGFGGTNVLHEAKVTGQQAALAHDLLSLMDALHMPRAHVVGHDWGSTTANSAALIEPNRFLTLTTLASPYLLWKGGMIPPEQVHAFWYQFYFQLDVAQQMLESNAVAFCKALWRTWSPAWRFSQAAFEEAAAAWNNPQFVAIVLNYYRMRWKNALSRPAYAQLQATLEAEPKPAIDVPALHIQGCDDACVLPAAVDGQEKYFTHGYGRIDIPGAGHYPHREKPADVLTAIVNHFDLHEP